MKRYEVQVKHRLYGWVTAGNWPCRTKAEGLRSLKACAVPFMASKHYRLVELVPRIVARATVRSREKA